jgi:hypothetical protein
MLFRGISCRRYLQNWLLLPFPCTYIVSSSSFLILDRLHYYAMKNEKSIFLVVRQMDVLQVILGFVQAGKRLKTVQMTWREMGRSLNLVFYAS